MSWIKNFTVYLSVVFCLNLSLWAQESRLLTKEHVVNEIRRTPDCFTQGLVYSEKRFYESCGLYGKSKWRVVDETWKILKEQSLEPKHFAEGLVKVGDELIQLTWQNPRILVWDEKKKNLKRDLPFPLKEGWGLAKAPEGYWVTDGSEYLTLLDESFQIIKRVPVVLNGKNIQKLNELEFAKGLLLVNVWQTGNVLVVEPHSGAVLEIWNLDRIWADVFQKNPQVDVLNGIAWDAGKQRLWVTGKLWPSVFEIKVRNSVIWN